MVCSLGNVELATQNMKGHGVIGKGRRGERDGEGVRPVQDKDSDDGRMGI